uniref:Venom peptide Htgkr16 n=1 Tax=Hadogenes troglodytes TaxID=1577150 RepID=A0A1B3IJA9_9SCOR|nr:venom peptide Htgkr16 [Hadogenes troglodytes]
MKTLPVIFLCLLVLLAAPSGIWCRGEEEHEPYGNNGWKRFLPFMGKRRVEILSTSQRGD